MTETFTFKVGDRVIGRPDQEPLIRGQKATVTAVDLYFRSNPPMLNVEWDDKSGDRSWMKSLYASRFDLLLLEEPVETTTLKSGDRVRFKPGTNFEEMHLGSYDLNDVTFEIYGDVQHTNIGMRAGAPWVSVGNFSDGDGFSWAYLDTLELADPPAETWVPADKAKVTIGTKAMAVIKIGSGSSPNVKTGTIIAIDTGKNYGSVENPYYLFESDDKAWIYGHNGDKDDNARNRWWMFAEEFMVQGKAEPEPEILTEFKAQVWKVAMEAATEHDMCDVVQQTLAKVGIFEPPKEAIKISEPPVGTTFSFLDSRFETMFLLTNYGWAYLHKGPGNQVSHGDDAKFYTFEEMASSGFRLFDHDGNAVCGYAGWNAEYLNERFKNA